MISTETVTIDGKELTRPYSDTFKNRRVGTDEIYEDATNVLDFQYEEPDIPLDTKPPTEDELKDALSILGVQT